MPSGWPPHEDAVKILSYKLMLGYVWIIVPDGPSGYGVFDLSMQLE